MSPTVILPSVGNPVEGGYSLELIYGVSPPWYRRGRISREVGQSLDFTLIVTSSLYSLLKKLVESWKDVPYHVTHLCLYSNPLIIEDPGVPREVGQSLLEHYCTLIITVLYTRRETCRRKSRLHGDVFRQKWYSSDFREN